MKINKTKFLGILLILSAALILFLCACGDTADNGENTDAIEEAGADAAEPATEPATPEPTPEPTPRPTRPPPPVFDELIILNCENLDANKLGNKITLSADDPAPGLSSSWVSPGPGDVIFQAVFDPVDVTKGDYMTGALKAWIWCGDLDGIGTGDSQFELCTKTNDVQENNWSWRDQITEVGWNAVYLPWDEARESDPEPDNTSLTYIRIYSVGRTADFKLGRVSIVPYGEIP